MLTLIKLGGSLITDKRVEGAFREDVMKRLAREIRTALTTHPDMPLIIGHGSGSFGHVAGKRYGTIRGVTSREDWRGFAEVAAAAAQLNHRVVAALREAGIPAMRFAPSASARCNDGSLVEMALYPLQKALANGLIPVVYGDVAVDEVRGGTIISTEIILDYIARHMPVERIILLGEVDGVLDRDAVVIPVITPHTLSQFRDVLRGSYGVDVTGGMLSKVEDMVALVASPAGSSLTIRIINGNMPGLLAETLAGHGSAGTLITAD